MEIIDIYSKKIIKRFWIKVNKTSNCWNWTASKRKFGHGQFRVKNKIISAHIFSWIIKNKKIPNLCILHKCDNPSCVRPSHLYEGTKKQNTIDSVIRNRHYETKRTHCGKGHKLVKGKYGRKCMICNKIRSSKYYYLHKNIWKN